MLNYSITIKFQADGDIDSALRESVESVNGAADPIVAWLRLVALLNALGTGGARPLYTIAHYEDRYKRRRTRSSQSEYSGPHPKSADTLDA